MLLTVSQSALAHNLQTNGTCHHWQLDSVGADMRSTVLWLHMQLTESCCSYSHLQFVNIQLLNSHHNYKWPQQNEWQLFTWFGLTPQLQVATTEWVWQLFTWFGLKGRKYIITAWSNIRRKSAFVTLTLMIQDSGPSNHRTMFRFSKLKLIGLGGMGMVPIRSFVTKTGIGLGGAKQIVNVTI